MSSLWYWEGNVQTAIIAQLVKEGWKIVSAANTATKERGPDIEAFGNGCQILFEVKGYPSVNYQNERRHQEAKKTNPTVQAPMWYA